MGSPLLTHIDQSSLLPRVIQKGLVCQIVVNDYIRLFQALFGLDGEESRVAGSSTDQVHHAFLTIRHQSLPLLLTFGLRNPRVVHTKNWKS